MSARFSDYAQADKMAVQLVNIYTQDCRTYAGGVANKPLYATLNENIRSGNPPYAWETMRKLLTEGLRRLGLKEFRDLYGSCHCPKVKKRRPFTFSQFASTTPNADAALGFLLADHGNSFIHIVNAKGLDIAKYSSFPSESEVLLSPDVNFDVIQVEKNINQIRKEIQNVAPGKKMPDTVKMFIKVRVSRIIKKPIVGFLSSCLCKLKPI